MLGDFRGIPYHRGNACLNRTASVILQHLLSISGVQETVRTMPAS